VRLDARQEQAAGQRSGRECSTGDAEKTTNGRALAGRSMAVLARILSPSGLNGSGSNISTKSVLAIGGRAMHGGPLCC
jgi:hypothetical protein